MAIKHWHLSSSPFSINDVSGEKKSHFWVKVYFSLNIKKTHFLISSVLDSDSRSVITWQLSCDISLYVSVKSRSFSHPEPQPSAAVVSHLRCVSVSSHLVSGADMTLFDVKDSEVFGLFEMKILQLACVLPEGM